MQKLQKQTVTILISIGIFLSLILLVKCIPDVLNNAKTEKEEEVTKYPILIPKDIVIPTESEYSVVRPYEEELQAMQPDGVLPVRGRIDSADHFLRSCGDIREKCCDDDEGHESLKITITAGRTNRNLCRPQNIDYFKQPFYCRCDAGTCDEFGDCCWTIAKTLLYQSPWRCHKVQDEMIWALMISKCPADTINNTVRIGCESPEYLPQKKISYLHDIPIYTKSPTGNGQLYRNIYCAECNGISNEDIFPMRIKLRCSHNFTHNEMADFMKSSVYTPGSRILSILGGDEHCQVYLPQLDHEKIDLKWVIPNIRYCRRATIDECPKRYGFPLDAAFCSSYTQIIRTRDGRIFKNPHCAKCNGVTDIKNDSNCQHDNAIPYNTIDSFRDGSPHNPKLKLSPSQAGAKLDSAGLSLLFDFDLKLSESFVGHDPKCPSDMMWDFLRNNCTLTQCAKGYKLDTVDGECRPVHEESENAKENGFTTNSPIQQNGNNSESELSEKMKSLLQDPVASSCYVLILHDHEYILLPNNSILVNQTSYHPAAAGGNQSSTKTLIFHPGEYSRWNETSISICARELDKGFTARFSPVLNYISLGALGISVVFSFCHIILFAIIPKMRNLPGKNLFCLTSSLFISQLVFLIFIRNETRGICVASAVIMHYFFLASFFWMNIMSFDIWRTFSGEFMKRRAGSRSGVGRTFIKYSAYAWIMPALIVVIAAAVDFWVAESLQNEILSRIRPLYGHNNMCWIAQGLSLFLFFALPAAILISTNIVLFIITARAIRQQSNDSQRVFNSKDSRSNNGQCGDSQKDGETEDDTNRMKLYAKLALIMGLTWITGFLSGMSGWEWLWYPFVIVNGLQGTFIFFAFDVKAKVWEMLKERVNYASILSKNSERYGINVTNTNTNSTQSTLTTTVTHQHGKIDA